MDKAELRKVKDNVAKSGIIDILHKTIVEKVESLTASEPDDYPILINIRYCHDYLRLFQLEGFIRTLSAWTKSEETVEELIRKLKYYVDA